MLKIWYVLKTYLLVSLLLGGCIQKKTNIAVGLLAPNIDMNLDNSEIGPNDISGDCFPDNSEIRVQCDGDSSVIATCENGSYVASGVEILNFPAQCRSTLIDPYGQDIEDRDTALPNVIVNMLVPEFYPPVLTMKLEGTCSPNGIDNVIISADSGMDPAQVTCSCVNKEISCPMEVSFDGSNLDPKLTAVTSFLSETGEDLEEVEVLDDIASRVFGPFNGWYSEDGTGGLCFKSFENKVYCWGGHTGGPGTSRYPTEMNLPKAVEYIVASESNAFAISTDGTLYGWGKDSSGSSGTGSSLSQDGYNFPQEVSGIGQGWDGVNRRVEYFSGDHTEACVILDNGELWSWGENLYGELGIGAVGKFKTPQAALDPNNPVPGNFVKNAKSVVCAGSTHCYADKDGKLYCSGRNTYGQLGLGTGSTTTSHIYQHVPGVSNVEAISIESWATTRAVCVLKSDKTVSCWGFGKGPGGSDTDIPTPLVDSLGVPLSSIKKIRSGQNHTCALKEDGTVWCVGQNFIGQLGNGTLVDSLSAAIQVPGINNAINLELGRDHSCALLEDKTIWCWGSNHSIHLATSGPINGQLGSLTSDKSLSPVQFMPSLGNVFIAFQAFAYDTCGLLINGKIYCMGQYPGTSNEGVDPLGNFIVPAPSTGTANLLYTASKNKESYIEGEDIIYSLNVRNLGPHKANNVAININCPAGTSFVSQTHTFGSFNNSTSTWNLSSLNHARDEVLTLTCNVDSGVTLGGLRTDLVFSSSQDEIDPSVDGDNLPFTTFIAYIPSAQCTEDYTGITSHTSAGDGTSPSTAFEIGNMGMYLNFLNSNANRDKFFILCDNLDFSSQTNPSSIAKFSGEINGNGKKISNFKSLNGFIGNIEKMGSLKNIEFENLEINCTGKSACSLIEKSTGATLNNITISGTSKVTSDKNHVAALIGNTTGVLNAEQITVHADILSTFRANGGFTGYVGGVFGYLNTTELNIKNIIITGTVTSDSSYLGGVIGRVRFKNPNGLIDSISSSATITYNGLTGVGSHIGGIIGHASSLGGSGKSQIKNISFSGNINADSSKVSHVGGALGYLGGLDSTDYIETFNVSVSPGGNIECRSPLNDGAYCGGAIGMMANFAELKNSSSFATVTGDTYVGGLVGYTRASLIDSSSSNGNVNCFNGSCGGLVGYAYLQSQIKNSHSFGNVTYDDSLETKTNFGGLIGYARAGISISDSSYQGSSVVGGSYTGGLIGYVTASTIEHQVNISNSFVKANSVKTIEGSITNLRAGGFIGRMDINYITMEISDSFADVANLQAPYSIGGFIALIDSANNALIKIRKSFSTGSASFLTDNPINNHFGGFIGSLYGPGATSNFDIKDSYSTMNLSTSVFNNGNLYVSLGGFIGRTSYANTTIENVYSSLSELDGQSLAFHGGAYLGRELYAAQHNVNDSFFISNLKNFSTAADYLVGGKPAASTMILSNTFYSSTATCTGSTPCDGSNGGLSAPVSNFQTGIIPNWDFSNIWEHRTSDFPKLRCASGAPASFCTAWDAAQ